MHKPRGKNLFFQKTKGFLLILVGFLFFAFSGYLKGKSQISFQGLPSSLLPNYLEKIEEKDLPKKIIIPKAGIELEVFPGRIIDGKWEISNKGVSYLLGSGIPGRKGNVVIYGHNKRNQFGPIRWLKINDEIKLINGKNEEFIYKVIETKTVVPYQVEILLSSAEEAVLTLYTCTGILDRYRFVIRAMSEDQNMLTPDFD